MKYKTLAELKAAFASGALADDGQTLLVVDNDCSHLYVDDECVYRGGGPEELIFEALELLGIPAQGA